MENASERYFYGDVLRRKHAMVEYRILLWLFYDLQPAKKIRRHFVLGHKTQNYYLLINRFLNPFFP